MFYNIFRIMADQSDSHENRERCFNNKLTNSDCSDDERTANLEEASSLDVSKPSISPDLNSSSNCTATTSSHISGSLSGQGSMRKEENPYSFKHFLITGGKQSGGARPRIDSSNRSNSEPIRKNSIDTNLTNVSCSTSNRNIILNNPELASGLPDFVQDHLIVEQCYIESSSSNPQNVSYNLEDSRIYQLENAILNSPSTGNEQYPSKNYGLGAGNDMPFDLTSTMPNERHDTSLTLPLDLPTFHSTRPRPGRPLDPPLDLPSASNTCAGPSNVNSAEVGASKSLPDFLSDGPIHQRRSDDPPEPESAPSPYPPFGLPPVERRLSSSELQAENTNLRREVQILSTQLEEKSSRLEHAELQINRLTHQEQTEMACLEKAVEQAEDNLKRTTKRAIAAETKVSKLKQEVKSLKAQLQSLQQGEHSSVNCSNGNGRDRNFCSPSQERNQRLASEIQNAASSAETSLRQLLSGIENLRVIASSLENSHRIFESSDKCSFDSDDNPDSPKS